MRIGQHDSNEKKRRLRPPPDYASRAMQWRLLGLVAALMFVLWAAFEARKPETWRGSRRLRSRRRKSPS